MTKNDIITQINLALKDLNVSKIILFGSYAKGNQTEDSDIDLLVVTNDNFVFESFAQKMEEKLKIARALDPLRKFADIDLIVHTRPMFEKFIQLDSGFKGRFLIQDQLFMKQTTSEWLHVAEDDLLAARALLREDRLANLVAFHCQQCLERSLRAILNLNLNQ